MPADIRNFFGGKSSQGSSSSPAKPPAKKEVCISLLHMLLKVCFSYVRSVKNGC